MSKDNADITNMNESLTMALDNENTHVTHLLFDKYGAQGYISREAISSMISDIYGNTRISDEPTSKEAEEEFFEILDFDKDGKVSFKDVEDFVSRYLVEYNSSMVNVKLSMFESQHGKRLQKAAENMANSFQSFDEDNLEIAREIFEDYDADEEGRIKRKDLPLVIGDILKSIGSDSRIDREILEQNIAGYTFEDEDYVYWEEFEDLYMRNFNL